MIFHGKNIMLKGIVAGLVFLDETFRECFLMI